MTSVVKRKMTSAVKRITRVPKIHDMLEFLYFLNFPDSQLYWERKYQKGHNSGPGSYNRLADFKADTINKFMSENNVEDAIEFGCGDGNVVSLIRYRHYTGFDVSKTAIKQCLKKFSNDTSKSFFLFDPSCFLDNKKIFLADLSLSLDVIFHLVEDQTFDQYMRALVASSKRYVIIYSSNYDEKQGYQIRQRKFSRWMETNAPEWRLIKIIKNKCPYVPSNPDTSFADFYFYQKD